MVEVKKFYWSASVDATYGGVDVAVQERNTGELVAEKGMVKSIQTWNRNYRL